MERKIIWLGAILGSFIGGLIPGLWDADFLSLSTAVCSALGGFAGIWLGYQLTKGRF